MKPPPQPPKSLYPPLDDSGERPFNSEHPHSEQRLPVHPDALLRFGFILGVGMIAAGFAWVNLLQRENLWDSLPMMDVWQVVPGLAAGGVFAILIWITGRQLPGAQRITAMIEQTIDLSAMTLSHIIVLSLLAAIPEEILFRGAMQSAIGLGVASIIFGALHALTRLYFVYATIAGLFLGALYTLSGALWMSIGAHFAVDVVMFILLLRQTQNRD